MNWNKDSDVFVFLGIIRIYFVVYKKRGPATASPQDERDISVDLVNNEANHFALYLYVPNNIKSKLIILCQT